MRKTYTHVEHTPGFCARCNTPLETKDRRTKYCPPCRRWTKNHHELWYDGTVRKCSARPLDKADMTWKNSPQEELMRVAQEPLPDDDYARNTPWPTDEEVEAHKQAIIAAMEGFDSQRQGFRALRLSTGESDAD